MLINLKTKQIILNFIINNFILKYPVTLRCYAVMDKMDTSHYKNAEIQKLTFFPQSNTFIYLFYLFGVCHLKITYSKNNCVTKIFHVFTITFQHSSNTLRHGQTEYFAVLTANVMHSGFLDGLLKISQ